MKDVRETPIQIIVKKKGHGGHHGGAWKVAFADFMTTMFALFLVLWLVNQSSDVKTAIAGYFRDPLGHPNERGSSMLAGPGVNSGPGQGLTPSINLRRTELQRLADRLATQLRSNPEFSGFKDHVRLELTEEGLRIQMMEDTAAIFFSPGSTEPMQLARDWLERLGQQLSQLPNMVAIEGHTDATPFTSRAGYSNWELSTDRANASRRLLIDGGLRPTQVSNVRGFASRHPLVRSNPAAPANRRVSITVLYWESDILEDYGNPDEVATAPVCPGYMGGECPDPEEIPGATPAPETDFAGAGL